MKAPYRRSGSGRSKGNEVTKSSEYTIKFLIIILVMLVFLGLWQRLEKKQGYPVQSSGDNKNIAQLIHKATLQATIGSFKNIAGEKTSYLQVLTTALFDFDYKEKASLLVRAMPFLGHARTQYAIQSKDDLEVAIPTLSRSTKVVSLEDNPQYYRDIEQDEIFMEEEITSEGVPINFDPDQLHDLKFLEKYIYLVDGTLDVTMKDFDIDYFLKKDMTISKKDDGPKVLLFHTHSQESFIDSRPGKEEDTVVGVGAELAKLLEQKYGITCLHDKKQYDLMGGKLDRNKSYTYVDQDLPGILKKYPSIEVVIDIHRDGIDGNRKLLTNIGGRPTARFMFFNGLSKLRIGGKMVPIASLPNPNLKDNLAFSFQMQMKANEMYGQINPSLTRKIYLKNYRYSTHMKPKSLLIEVGAQNNTVQEAKNAMIPLAAVLNEVLMGK